MAAKSIWRKDFGLSAGVPSEKNIQGYYWDKSRRADVGWISKFPVLMGEVSGKGCQTYTNYRNISKKEKNKSADAARKE
jgi:hypothetical protein